MRYSAGHAIDFSCLPQSDKLSRLLTYMRQLALVFLAFLTASAFSGRTQAQTLVHEMEFDQAREVALIVARYDHITVDDHTVVMDSMDTRRPAGFLPGYYSFTIIRESDSPSSPDETIRMYAISKRTGDTWEMNLCTHYSFPGLQRLQTSIMRKTGATPEDDLKTQKAIGCSSQAGIKNQSE
jgi:hypothetical protein